MRAQWRGYTLVEVLVALSVLAIGVAGAGATQLTAERTRQQAALTSEAAQLAATLAARMQVNPSVAGLPDAGNPYLALDYDAADGPPGAGAGCFGGAGCTPAQLAEADLGDVRHAVHTRFPRGRVRVCRDGAPWDGAAGRYRWHCDLDAGAVPVVKLGWEGTGDAPGYVAVLR